MNHLKKLRLQRNIKQTELAKALDVKQSYISLLESSAREMSVKNLLITADLFGCSVDELLDRKIELSQSTASRFKKLEKLPASQRTLILKSIDMLIAGAD